jgi:hypothetical protein
METKYTYSPRDMLHADKNGNATFSSWLDSFRISLGVGIILRRAMLKRPIRRMFQDNAARYTRTG